MVEWICDLIPQSWFPFSPPVTRRWLNSVGSQCSYAERVRLVSVRSSVQVSLGGQSSSGTIVKWHMLELGAHGTCKTSILNGLAVDHLGIRDESNRCCAFKHLDKEMKTWKLHILFWQSETVKLAFVCDVPSYSDKVLFVFKWKYGLA